MAQHYISIGPMYCVIWVVAFLETGGAKRQPHSSPSKHETITRCCFNAGPASKTLTNIKTVLGEWHVFAGVLQPSIQQTQCCWASVVDNLSALNQQWAATLAQHWTKVGCVGLHRVYLGETRRTTHWQGMNGCWPAPAMEWINVEDIF